MKIYCMPTEFHWDYLHLFNLICCVIYAIIDFGVLTDFLCVIYCYFLYYLISWLYDIRLCYVVYVFGYICIFVHIFFLYRSFHRFW